MSNVIQAPFKTDLSKGSFDSRVSSQWFSRPDDQRWTSLRDLHAYKLKDAQDSHAFNFETNRIEVQADMNNPDKLDFVFNKHGNIGIDDHIVARPNHWSFGQTCSLVGVPAAYMRRLPGPIAGINMQHAFKNFRSEMIKAYVSSDSTLELRAATGPDYGRIYDHEVVESVMKIAGDGTGDSRWKIPGTINWRTGMHDPNTEITRESTTLFASDRDIYLFLVDDRNPITIGTLPDGSPDLVFRGFIVWNSEVGSKTLVVLTFYLRGVCANRCLWGVEGFQEIRVRHSKNAPLRFIHEVAPALERYAEANTGKVLAGIQAARETIVARDDEDRIKFLTKNRHAGFSRSEASDIIQAVVREEGAPPVSVWDFVQGITAVARSKPHQDARVAMEMVAGRMLDKVA